MPRFGAVGESSRAGWCNLPSKPKTLDSTGQRKLTPQARKQRDLKARRRALILKHLGITESSVQKIKRPRFSRVHIHPDVLLLSSSHNGGLKLPDEVPIKIASAIAQAGFSYTNNDRLDPSDRGSPFLSVPNYTTAAAEAEIKTLEDATVTAGSSKKRRQGSSLGSPKSASPGVGLTPSTRQGGGDVQPSSHSKREREARRLIQSNPDAAAKKMAALEDQKENAESMVQHLLEQLTKERAEHEAAKKRYAAMDKETAMIQLELEMAGLSRATITNPEWHKANKAAASHLFGFQTWEHTVNYLLMNFEELENPRKSPAVVDGCFRNHPMTDFEKCLLTKMRIHRGQVIISHRPPAQASQC